MENFRDFVHLRQYPLSDEMMERRGDGVMERQESVGSGAVWGRTPPNRAEKNSPPLGVGVASNIPDAMIKRHGGGISDDALWPYRNKKRGASRHPFLLSMMGNSLGALTPGRTNGNHKASA